MIEEIPYWRAENPVVIKTKRIDLQWYREAKRLTITQNRYVKDDGVELPERHRTLSIGMLSYGIQNQEERQVAIDIFAEIIEILKGEKRHG